MFYYILFADDLSTVVSAATARKSSEDATGMELDESTNHSVSHSHAGAHHAGSKKGGPAGLPVESCKRQKSLQGTELTRVPGVHAYDPSTAPPPKRLVFSVETTEQLASTED